MGRVLTAFVLFVSLGCAAARADSAWANIADPVFERADLAPIGNPGIYAIAQDARGFLWIGAPTGLWRYDGYEFRSLTTTGSPSPSNVESLVDDGRGTLWIGTQSSGLEQLDEKTETFRTWPPDPKGRSGPRSATIIAMARGRDGNWWIGGDSGLDVFTPATQAFAPVSLGAPNRIAPRVEAIHVDRHQTVWVGTVRGLYRRTAGTSQFRAVRLGKSDRAAVFSLYEDERGQIWAGSINALYALSAQGQVVRSYASSSAATSLLPGEQWAIAEAAPGEYWVGSGDGGITIVNAASNRIRRVGVDRANPASLTPGQVWQIFHDRSGLLWIVNDAGGLLSYNPHNRGIYQLSPYDRGMDLGDRGTRSVAAANDGSLWVGGGDSVVHVDPNDSAQRSYHLEGNASVQTLHVDAKQTLWIGTARGLCRLPLGAAAVECPAGTAAQVGRVMTLIDDGPTLWIGTDSGVVAWDTKSGAVVRYRHSANPASLSNDYVEALYEDSGGHIWAGTANGVNRIDPNGRSITRFEHDPHDASTLGSGQVPAMLEDDDGNLWVAAEGGPLNLVVPFTDGFTVRRLGTGDGLPANVTGLEAGANGSIWASVSDALVRIDTRTLHGTTLGAADGVQQSDFWPRPARASNGTVFFPGANSVVVLASDARAPWSFAPQVVLTSITLGHQSVPPPNGADSMVELPSSDRQLSVEFAALDYSAPQTLRYEYRLQGYDRDWIATDAAHRMATYTNLAPGDYTLFVRATNRAGEWSPNVIALRVSALAAWYETWWFKGLFLALCVAAILAVIRGRTAILRRRAEQLEEVVERRTLELAQANAALEKMTITDPLTGLHNRRFLTQRIAEDVALALRQKSDLVFFIVDIDHFKAVNDELGHAAGDRVLTQMRERLESVFRASDYVLRWGGEEFLAVTRATTRDDAADIAERLRNAIARKPFTIGEGQFLLKTASIGFAAFPFVPEKPEAVSWEQVVTIADQALYKAKNAGRDTWFGLAASENTDPTQLASLVAHSPESAVADCALTVIIPAQMDQHLRV